MRIEICTDYPRTHATIAAIALCLAGVATAQERSLSGPASVAAGAPVTVSLQGEFDPLDFVAIVPADAPEGKYDAYQYARSKEVDLTAPEVAGAYELRVLSKNSPYPTISRQAIEVTAVSATLTVPESVEAGANFDVQWQGPGNDREFITVVKADAPEHSYDVYVYAGDSPTVTLRAPEEPGNYEVRYLSASKYYTLGAAPLTIAGTSATLEAPDSVAAGADVEVRWTGPGNPLDFLTIVPAGAAESTYDEYRYTQSGEVLVLRAPDEAGAYEIRYCAGQSYKTLGSRALTVEATSATLNAPAEAVGGSTIDVSWEGPDNRGDFVGLTKAADVAAKHHATWAYTENGSPARVTVPVEPGDYVLTYETGNSSRVLAERPLTVTPPTVGPGTLQVFAAGEAAGLAFGPDSAVEIVLDASGSMFKQQGGRTRIDIAQDVLSELVTKTIPAGTAFAFRAFGHREESSCRTDLEIPLQPLDPASAASVVGGVTPMKLAKTPIGRSLELVKEDLGSVRGERVVVLLTDGEETCGGDPGAAIEGLAKAGVDVRVNIVGFAIDDANLKSQFRYWAELGGGSFFDSADAAELGAAMVSALRVPYTVTDASGQVVARGEVGGEPVTLPAGDYTVRADSRPPTERAVTIKPEETARLDLQSGGS